MKTASEIAAKAAQRLLDKTGAALEYPGESPIAAVAWEMGNAFTYEVAICEIIGHALDIYRAERSPVLIDPDEAQGLADRFREAAEGDSGDIEISAASDMAEYLESLAAEARKATEDETIPPVPLDVFADIDERVGSQDYAPYTLAAHDNSGYVDVVVIADYLTGESVYKYTREPDGSVKWELLAARAHRSDA